MGTLTNELKAHPLALFPDFRKLFAGRVVSAVGDKFFAIAIAWWVLSEAGEKSKFHLGLIMAMNVIPVVAFGPLLGTLSDRSDKRRVMLAADGARALLVSLLALLLWSGRLNLYWLYSICFLISGFGPLFESAEAASILRLTSPEKMPQAVAVDSSILQLSNVIGSALGSALMAAAGVAGAFLFNAAGYLVSFAAIWGIKTELKPQDRTESSFTAEFKEGLAYTFGNRPVLWLILTFATFNFFVAPILIIIPMIVKFVLKESVTWLAVFETFFALGSASLAAALSFKRAYGNIYGWFFVSLLAVGLSFGGLYFTANKYAICALIFCAGAALGGGNTVVLTLFQSTVPDAMKGRFFSVLTTLAYAVLPLAFLATGLLADKFSVGFCIAMNATAVLALSFAALLIPRVRSV
ncbi:MAG: antiporter [Elusimicrobia bacterium CG08_land_8_20_14_0_20_59_10]|nr:MAG: antiporter [Elusimicrobia bacterium CG08_land_8_20_14_0_20_59_10]